MIRNIIRKLIDKPQQGTKKCPVCGTDKIFYKPIPQNYLRSMHKHGFMHSVFLFETLNLFEYTCSHCGAADRDRLYAIYLEVFFHENTQEIRFLDIAPSKSLSLFLDKFSNVNRRTTDLFMENVDDKQDLTNMHLYEDNRFDFVLCSHVLEHVPDDVKALSEIYRVMKPGAKAILMAPINLGLKEITEDSNCTDTALRWRYFGQDDHIRLYSKDGFVKRIESVGFKVQQLGKDYFGDKIFIDNSIFESSVLYIAEK